MIRFVVVGVGSGLLFGVLDGVVNGNPLAAKLYQCYTPIAKEGINIPAGVAIDLVYGFVLAGVFLLLYRSLPGETGWVKGLSYGLLTWFFRVVMSVVSQWMMFDVPAVALAYSLVAGLAEMLTLGIVYGLALRPMA